jgi:hypothetical protein
MSHQICGYVRERKNESTLHQPAKSSLLANSMIFCDKKSEPNIKCTTYIIEELLYGLDF